MDGFWGSLSRWFNEKTSSPLYFTYVAFFIAWNWKFFQIIFLEDSNLFSAPRIEYINADLLFSFSVPFAWHWVAVLCVWLANALWHILPPAGLTYLSIKYLPKLHDWAFKIYVENHFNRKSFYRTASVRYEKGETKKLEEVASEKQKQATQKSLIEKSQTKEEKWDDEYEKFRNTIFFKEFSLVRNIIYENNGWTSRSNLSSQMKAYCDTNGLVDFERTDSERISLTEKGRYFMKRYVGEGFF